MSQIDHILMWILIITFVFTEPAIYLYMIWELKHESKKTAP